MRVRSRRALDSLETLNGKARTLSFSLSDVPWDKPADRNRDWLPGNIAALSFLPAYALLDAAEQRRCNQLYAIGLCEQFIWLETLIIAPMRVTLRRPDLPQALREALQNFIEEEDKHIAMFWRLLERSEPQWYPPHRARLFTPAPLYELAERGLARYPTLFVVWLWLAIFAEERTVFISREYLRARKTASGSIDALHTRVHELHMKDEARHCQLDQHLLTWLYDREPTWKKRLCGWMFYRLVRSYVFPHRTALRILEVMEGEFPRLRRSIAPRLRSELPQVGYDPAFHRRLFSRSAMPRTLALLREYREHDRLWTLFLTEEKGAP